jgi:Flp pilus assembly pilin Flp
MAVDTPSLFYGFSWTAAIADGLIAGLIAVAILPTINTLGAELTDTFSAMTTHASATQPFD